MAIGKKRLAARLSQAITGAINTAAEIPPYTTTPRDEESCAPALHEFARKHPDTELQPVPHWRLLSLLP